MHPLLTLVLLGVFLCLVTSAPSEDLITDLPGVPYPPPFRQYSGYLKTTGTKYLHYWLVESERDPANDPIVVWYNGGPGCSSLGGFFNELGPFKVDENGKDLFYNPYSWNKVANVFYVESPAGVGMSYAEDGDTATNDSMTAIDNYWALKSFFAKFPEYKERDFYITGESYAGIYIPTLTSIVLDDPSINLKGIAIGNGLLNWNMNDNSIIIFAYNHGMIGDGEYGRLLQHCCGEMVPCDFVANSDWQCLKDIAHVNSIVNGGSLDRYNLYNPCVGGVPFSGMMHYDDVTGKHVNTYFGYPFGRLQENLEHMQMMKELPKGTVKAGQVCQNNTRYTVYLDRDDVRKAIHVSVDLPPWEECSSSLDYTRHYTDMTPQIQKALQFKIRVLIYNGDVDMACNFLGDEWFVDELNLPGGTRRREWFYQDEDGYKQVGGWTKHYDGLDFLTVRGSGHFVPTDRPKPALTLFQNFVENKPY